MNHRLFSGALLLLIVGTGCAEATQAPDAAASATDTSQAGSGGGHAGTGTSFFQPSSAGGLAGGATGGATSSLAAGGQGGRAGASGVAGVAAGGVAAGGALFGAGGAGAEANVAGTAGAAVAVAGSSGATGAADSCAPRLFSYADQGHTLTGVGVSGTFNAWSMTGIPLSYDGASQSWQVSMTLDAGTYQYKFVVNGSDWKADPENSNSVGDGYGGVNSVVVCQ